MKNFTNNFKQFTSRLSARWLIMALMMLVGTSSAWGASSFASGDVIYVDVSACSWYENDGCGPGIQLNKTGNYIKMDKVADKLYTYTFAQSVTSFNLGRVAATGTTKHNNFGGTFTNYEPSSKNVFKVNSGSTDGSWESPSFIKVYFDNSNTNWTNIYMCYGHSSYSKMNVKVNNQACGNIYYAIITDNWTDETQIAFHNSTQADTSWGSEDGSIAHRYGWLNGDVTHTYDITLDNANGKVFKPSKSTSKLTTGNNGKQIDAHLWDGDDAYAEETFSQSMCCTAPTSAPTLSKVSDIVKCGTTTITSGTLEIVTVNTGSTYYYKIGTNGTEQEITLNNKQFTVSSEGDYYVKEVNDCGASSSWSTTEVTISEINNQVSISAITGSETICAGVTGQEYSIETIDGVSSYAWSVTGEGLSTNSSTSNSVLISAENKTSQVDGTLSVTVTKNGCETTIQQPKSITLIPLPTITTVDPTSGKACSNTTIADLEAGLTITKSDNSDTKWYKGVEEKSSTATVETGEYTIKAISNIGSCVSNSSVTYNVTGITTIPTGLTIDINGKTSASICGGTATINAKATGATSYSLYKGNGDLVETINGDANGVSFTVSGENTYKVKATNNCGTTDYSSDVTLTVNPVPSFTTRPSSVTLCSNSTPISVLDLIQETGAKADNSATIGLYAENGDEIEGDIDINVNTLTTTTYKLKAFTQTCSSDFVEFTLTVNPLPAAPSLTSPAPVCEGTTVYLPTGFNWYNAEIGGNKVADTAIEATGTYWAAAKQNNCESATRTRYDVTVNPTPTISISGKETAVLYEDVILTATATDGATVKWYEGVVEKGEGLTYVVTSETATSKTITAKAFLGDCESDFKEHEVTFGEEEDCEPTITTHTTKTKILFTKPSEWDKIYIYSWDITDSKSNSWPGYEITGEEYYVFENVTKDFNIILNNGNGNGTNQTVNGEGLKAGKVYSLTIGGTSSTCTDGKRCLDLGDPTDFTTTSDPELSAPAVKTVSVNSEQGSGVVNFVGRVIKTGCASGTKIYVGYQYKKADDEWPTTGVTAGTGEKELIPIGNNLVDFSKNIEGLADDDYHFRAYVINGYGRSADPNDYDQGVYYGIDILVKVSSIKEAVKDPVLQWIDEEGYPYPGGAYCPDATAYVKLTYGGSKPETVVWSNSISDSNPVLVKESLGENWYKLTVEKSGDLSVSLANEYNTTGAVQADAISLTMTSRISFPTTEVIDGKTTICSNDANGTELRVTNAVVDYQYALYKVTDEAAGTSTIVAGPTLATDGNKDNLTFTIQGAEAAGKYFVQVEETVCDQTAVSQGYTTIEVIDAGAITLTLEPNEVTVNPWLPAVLTVSITEGYDYTIDIPAPLVYTANGNVYTIKAPEPADAEYQPSSQQNTKQYGKVMFEETNYTVTADLKTDTGSSCITEKTSTITLTPYVEDCVSEYENQ